MIRLHAHPLPSLSPSVSEPATHKKTEKERKLTDGRGVGGHGAEAYDGKEAWPSRNLSIHFAATTFGTQIIEVFPEGACDRFFLHGRCHV